MATLLTCTRTNDFGSIDSAEVVINDKNRATIQNASASDFGTTLRIFFTVAFRNQKQILLSISQSETGEKFYRYGESEKTVPHETYVKQAITDLHAEGIHAEITGSENE